MTWGFNNAGQLADLIKGHWREARIVIATSIGGLKDIKRVSFHQNHDGKVVVVMHETHSDDD